MADRDQDILFTGIQRSSTTKSLIGQGEVSRLINARFVEGAISNGLGFREYSPEFAEGPKKRVYASRVTYQQLLDSGDYQLSAPLNTITGKFQVEVISGVLFLINLQTNIAYDITPVNSNLPRTSNPNNLSYLDNDGGVYGAGAYLVIFNWPNLPIFVSQYGARVSNPKKGEMLAARLGATAGTRAFVITGDNILWASDPVGGASSLAPLTFSQTYDASTGFTGQTFTIGSALDVQYVTALCRLPKFLGPNQPFLAQNLLASSVRQKNIIAAGLPRAQWETAQFITYAGSGEGVAGPLACTNIGDNVVYIASNGKIKTIAQATFRETGLVETYMDDPLGQYTCCLESDYWYKPWYEDLDHSRSIVKFNRDRLLATVYPVRHPAVGMFGEQQYTLTHRALAIASLSSETLVGAQAQLVWEGFYDWCNPCGLITVGDEFYVTSKDVTGRIRRFVSNFRSISDASSSVITRGYFNNPAARTRSISAGYLYFRSLEGRVGVSVSALINGNWQCIADGFTCDKVFKFTVQGGEQISEAGSISLKVDLHHKGCRFELEGVKLDGEYHYNTR